LKPPGIEKLIGRVLDCEGEATHWSLKDRLVLVNDVLDGFAAAGMLSNMLHTVFLKRLHGTCGVSQHAHEYSGLPLSYQPSAAACSCRVLTAWVLCSRCFVCTQTKANGYAGYHV
jgi:hypothetical protein